MKKLFQTLSAAMLISFALVPYAFSGTSPTPAPAPACGKCGDGYCAKQCGETAQSCPKDCGVAY
jgi:hypothetical protein